jgi:NADPH2:quinone reductase
VRARAPLGVDVVYDSIGRTLAASLALARTGGTVVRADRLFAAVRTGDLKVQIGAVLALRDGAQAHALLEGRGVAGKVLLIP